MARPSPIDDPKTREYVLENLAKGVRQSIIARAIGVHENTIITWKKKKSFARDLALKTLELATEPIEKVRQSNPLAYLERHPEFRDQFAPPKQKAEVDGHLTVTFEGFGDKNTDTL